VACIDMSLNYYKSETEIICKQKGWTNATVDTVWLLLTEEIGELASAIRQYKKTYKKTNLKKERGTDIMMEMGDVFSYLFQISSMLNVDLDKMWLEHGKKMKYKKYNL
jgi:NTP pyrophosphatase (non-canonical NTP hydrolase)